MTSFQIGTDFIKTATTTEAGREKDMYHLTLDSAGKWALSAPNKEVGNSVFKMMFQSFKNEVSQAQTPQVPQAPQVLPEAPKTDLSVDLYVRKGQLLMDMAKLFFTLGADDRDRILIKDAMRNHFGECVQASAVPPIQDAQVSRRCFPLTDFLREKGIKYNKLSSAEFRVFCCNVAKIYQQVHGKQPPKREQYVDGASRMVNHYTDDDREILEDAFNRFNHTHKPY